MTVGRLRTRCAPAAIQQAPGTQCDLSLRSHCPCSIHRPGCIPVNGRTMHEYRHFSHLCHVVFLLQYYRSPGGKRFRSRNEALKSLGFGEDKSKEKKSPSKAPGKATPKPKEERLSHEEALAKAKAEAAESPLSLPLKLGNGVKVLK